MAARVEQLLISTIVLHPNGFNLVEKLKINDSFFQDEQCRELFKMLREHYYNRAHFGETMSADQAYRMRPGFSWDWRNETSIPALCEELRTYKIRTDGLNLAQRIESEVNSTNPRTALDTIKAAAIEMARDHSVSEDLTLSSAWRELQTRYDIVRDGKGMTGIPWPWEALNSETLGLQKSHYIVIYGRPKSGKTWVGVATAANAFALGQRALIYSMEMRSIEVIERVACYVAQVDYDLLRKGTLHLYDPAGFERLRQWMSYLESRRDNPDNTDRRDLMATSDDDAGGGGITSLHSKIREFNPDIVVVDAMYLMGDDRTKTRTADWKVVTHVSRDLKLTAKQFNIPVIGITQANRLSDKNPKNADLREISYGDALGQDADLVMRVDRRKDEETHEWEIVLGFPGSRHSGKLDAFAIYCNPCVNLSQKRIIATADTPPEGPTSGGTSHGRRAPVVDRSKFGQPGGGGR